MISYYTDDLTAVREDMLRGFFVGWPRRPSPAQHLAVLRASYRSVVAIDAADRVAGFVNMLSDGIPTAFIPWLEVLPVRVRASMDDYGAVIAYNTARTPGLGSAIFLHINIGTPTAGCVKLPVGELLKVLRWLNLAASPRITMGVG